MGGQNLLLLILLVKCHAKQSLLATPFQSKPLRWRHNGHDSVSNHQPRGCLLSRLFRRKSKKTSKLRVAGLCVGNSPGPVNIPHQGPVTRKMFPFDDVIMRTQKKPIRIISHRDVTIANRWCHYSTTVHILKSYRKFTFPTTSAILQRSISLHAKITIGETGFRI